MLTQWTAALFLFAGTMRGSPSGAGLEVQWAPELRLERPSEAMKRLGEPFDSPLAIQNGSQTVNARNCTELLDYRKSGYAPVSDRDGAIIQSRVVDCLAVKALYHAATARVSFLRSVRLDAQTFELLPASLAPAISDEDRQKIRNATSNRISWKQVDPSATASEQGDSLVVLSAETRTALKIYGRGDFNADGIDDLLIRVDVAALRGTYRTSRLLLLTRTHRDGPLEMIRAFI